MPLHPKLVHLPIALAALMPLVSLGLLLAWWRGLFPRRTWIIAILLQAILLGGGLAAAASGEQDEGRVEGVVPEPVLEAHEEAAEGFLIASGVVLALGLLGALVPRERIALSLAGATFAGTVVVLVLGVRVGAAGGRLVYEHGAGGAIASGGVADGD